MKNPDFLKKTPKQRKAAYKLAKELGASPTWASRMKDWRSPKLFRAYGLEVPKLKERRVMGLVNPKSKTRRGRNPIKGRTTKIETIGAGLSWGGIIALVGIPYLIWRIYKK